MKIGEGMSISRLLLGRFRCFQSYPKFKISGSKLDQVVGMRESVNRRLEDTRGEIQRLEWQEREVGIGRQHLPADDRQ